MDFIKDVFWQTWVLVAEVAPWLLVGFGLAGIISLVLKRSLVVRLLGRPGLGSIVRATLVGVPMPLCSCGVIPVAAAIRERGASKGATAAFLASTPETGVDSVAATWGLLGPFLAGVRVVVAFVTGIVAGFLVQLVSRKDDAQLETDECELHGHSGHKHAHAAQAEPAGSCCHGGSVEAPVEEEAHARCCGNESSRAARKHAGASDERVIAVADADAKEHACCCHGDGERETEETDGCCGGGDKPEADEPHSCCGGNGSTAQSGHSCCSSGEGTATAPNPGGFVAALKYGFMTLPQDMLLSLTLGLLLAGIFGALLPADFFANLGLTGFWAYLAITLAAIPLYVCSTGSIPFAYVLLQAGLTPGGVLVFLVTGPATNVATLATMRRYIGGRGIAAYLAAIVGTAWAAGAIIDAGLGRDLVLSEIHAHVMEPALYQHIAGVALVAMLAYAGWCRYGPSSRRAAA